MSGQQTWAEALNINPEKLSEWSAKAPGDTPLLVWCLECGHISVGDYLAWASDHYGLPVLSSQFFEASFEHAALNKYREDGQWTAWCFPVSQWEDVTLVACVEPPTERPEGTCAFVLADPAAMHHAWGSTQTNVKPNPAAAEVEVPVGITATSKPFVLNLDSLLSENPVAQHAPEPKPAPAPPAPPPQLENTGLSLVLETEEHVQVPPPRPTLPPPAPAPAAKAPAASATPPAKPQSIPVAKAQPAAPPKPQAAPAAKAQPVPAAAAVQPPPTTKMQAAPTAPKPVVEKFLKVDDEVQAALTRLKEDYHAAVIMKCSEGAVKPFKWVSDMDLTVDGEKSTVNLSYPSFFRIVAKTMQPYHGYVIDSPIHKEFFESLNLEGTPACVTAAPIKIDAKLWGILVAFGGEASQSPQALALAQAMSEKLAKLLEPDAAKAA